jgi:hypothetical protein
LKAGNDGICSPYVVANFTRSSPAFGGALCDHRQVSFDIFFQKFHAEAPAGINLDAVLSILNPLVTGQDEDMLTLSVGNGSTDV